MISQTLTLDDQHIYRLDGKIIDSLTSTIQGGGFIRNSDPWYMDRGMKIHLATELWDKGTLDEETLDSRILPYLESWKRFKKEQDYTPLHIEHIIYHPQLLVGCKIDRLPGPIDLKSGVYEPFHVLQISFQWATLKTNGMEDMVAKPQDVYLDADGGSPKVKTYSLSELRDGFKAFASMLYFLRWKREHFSKEIDKKW